MILSYFGSLNIQAAQWGFEAQKEIKKQDEDTPCLQAVDWT